MAVATEAGDTEGMHLTWNGRSAGVAAAGVVAALLVAGVGAGAPVPANGATGAASRRAVLIAAGDLSCDPADLPSADPDKCQERAVGRMVRRAVAHGAVGFLALGDLQYDQGALRAFRAEYDRAFGAVKRVTHPVAGNHEWFTRNAAGYFTYFGRQAGTAARPWRSFVPRRGWRVVLLDSQCDEVGGCGPHSRQGRWLARRLRTTPQPCVIAAWHFPMRTSGPHGKDAETHRWAQQLWAIADRGGVDVVLNGHDHLMERFALLDGMRQFTSGAGGRSHYSVTDRQPDSRFVDVKHFGVLRLELAPHRYTWRFVAVGGQVLDRGAGRCSNPRR